MSGDITEALAQATYDMSMQIGANEAILDRMMYLLGQVAPDVQRTLADTMSALADGMEQDGMEIIARTAPGATEAHISLGIEIFAARWRQFAAVADRPEPPPFAGCG